MQSKARLGLVTAALLFTAACGGTTTGDTNGDAGRDGSAHPDANGAKDSGPDVKAADVAPGLPYPASPPMDPPQVITLGGPVLKSPKIVPIYFTSDDPTMTAQFLDFVSKVGQSKYWLDNVTEYGAGAATSLTPIELDEALPATIDDSTIQLWLADKLNNDDPAFPTPDANTLYALFFPPGVTITIGGTTGTVTDGGIEGTDGGGMDAGMEAGGGFGGVSASCTSFGGYHENISLDPAHGGMYVPYAVIPRCASFQTGGPDLMGIDVITGAASHEFIEATTDPLPISTPAYLTVDTPHEYWERVLGGGEVCDMCAQFPTAFTKGTDVPYMVQRCWSNAAEKAGSDPCRPESTGEVYFNTVPELQMVPSNFEGMTTNVLGVTIPVGMSQTVTLDLFSEGPTAPWTVGASGLSFGATTMSNLDFSFDKTTGQNGDKIQMTIKVLSASMRNHEEFVLTSTQGSTENIWIGFVNN
jgi:hypothetical protein